ncbi:MAG: DNA-3-methyladenine glycosylase family protein, partial [Nocardioidaceae bacterium]
RTPDGPGTLRLRSAPADGEVRAAAWGPGGRWLLDRVPSMLGAGDDPTGFRPAHPRLADALRRHPGWRVTSTGLVFEAVVAAAIEQKVTGHEAWRGWRLLLRRFGEPAPGPGEGRGMRVLPTPARVRMIPSWEWLRCHVDPARSKVVVRAARVADALERTVGQPVEEVERALRSLPGVGVWTAAEVRQRAHGDADAVSFGDYHVAKNVGWALTGQPVDDDGLAELLEPYRPHRYRVQRLLELTGAGAPRRGPRMPSRRHLPH